MIVIRSPNNPILKPNRDHTWEAHAVMNGCPVKKDGKIYLVYRALSHLHYHTYAKTKMIISDIGIAESSDGEHFAERRRFIVPENSWERYGLDDPRVTEIDGKYYIFYTALSLYPFTADGIKVGLAISTDLKTIDEKHLVTTFNSKGMSLFPQKIKDKYWAVLTVNTDRPPAKLCVASFDKIEDLWSEAYWQKWYKDYEKHSLELTRLSSDHVEGGAPPILTEYGWLMIYSYIKNYFSEDKLFTIEAVLLNKDNPQEVLARTQMPILTPEEYYEKIGIVSDIVFPSGAFIEDDTLKIYYGGADTTCNVAYVELSSLMDLMLQRQKRIVKLTRSDKNPIISPIKEHDWEAKATFNPTAIFLEDKVHIIYRAMSEDNTSVFGYAESKDGVTIEARSDKPIYLPRGHFEEKLEPNSNSGCEDPRLSLIDDKIYMCYTAFDGKNVPRVALTTIGVDDFLKKHWEWSVPTLISPPDYDDKDALIFPEKVGGKFLVIHRIGTDMDLSFHYNLNFKDDIYLEEDLWVTPRRGWWDSRKVGAAAAPIKTEEGWVLLYHGISDSNIYRVGALLLDLKDPTRVLGRTDNPIIEPDAKYEIMGIVQNVVFPCGNVLIGDTLFVYYGGADKVVGVATCDINELVGVLKLCKV